MRNVFFQKSYTKCERKTIHILFSKTWNVSICLGQWPKVLYSLSGYRNIFKLSYHLLYHKALPKDFSESKKRSGTSLIATFWAWFWRQIFLVLYSINRPDFIDWFTLLREILGSLHCEILCWKVVTPLFFVSQVQNIRVLLLIRNSYTIWRTWFISLKLCVAFSIFYSVLFSLNFKFFFNKKHVLFDFKTS